MPNTRDCQWHMPKYLHRGGVQQRSVLWQVRLGGTWPVPSQHNKDHRRVNCCFWVYLNPVHTVCTLTVHGHQHTTLDIATDQDAPLCLLWVRGWTCLFSHITFPLNTKIVRKAALPQAQMDTCHLAPQRARSLSSKGKTHIATTNKYPTHQVSLIAWQDNNKNCKHTFTPERKKEKNVATWI